MTMYRLALRFLITSVNRDATRLGEIRFKIIFARINPPDWSEIHKSEIILKLEVTGISGNDYNTRYARLSDRK